MKNDNIIPEPERGARTEIIFDTTCFSEPANPFRAEDVNAAIEQAVELDERPVFLEGLSERLNQLGIRCTADDTDIIHEEKVQKHSRKSNAQICKELDQRNNAGTYKSHK